MKNAVHRTGATIVVGESNFVTSRLLVASLQAAGYVAVAGRTGEDVVALIDKHGSDVLILNLNLMQPSGIELLRTLQNRPVKLKILAATNSGQADMRPVATSLGVVDFFEMPFAPSALTAQLHRILEQSHVTP